MIQRSELEAVQDARDARLASGVIWIVAAALAVLIAWWAR